MIKVSRNRFMGSIGWSIVWVLLTASALWAAEASESYSVASLAQLEVLDLETAAKIALAESPSLAAAQERVTQAAQLVKQAQAPYWPQLEVSGGYSQVRVSQSSLDQQYGAISQLFDIDIPDSEAEDYYKIQLKASWLLFDGLAREFTVAAARYGHSASLAAEEDTQRLLLSSVASAYLQAQLAQENVLIAKADEAFNQRLLTEAKLRYDVGTGALSDVLNFEIRVNAAQSKRIQEERGYQAGRIGLAALLGVTEGVLPQGLRLAELAAVSAQELVEPQSNELVQTALKLRPDLKRSDSFVQQAEAGVKRARAGYFPTIALEASHTGERAEDTDFNNDDFGDTIGIGLTWNIFAGGLTRAQHGEAKAKLFEAQRLRDDAHVQITAQINKIVTLINASRQQLLLQESNTKLVQKQRDLVEKEYKAGVGSLVRLNEAQKDLTVSQAQLTLSRAALRLAWYELRAATGEIVGLIE